MKFAICDNNDQDLSLLSALLSIYQKEKNIEFSVDIFLSEIEFLSVCHNIKYDVVFLAILMPTINGIQVAQEIRSINETVKIIFLTSSPDFAVYSYEVKAYNYFLKPITKEKLYPVLDNIFLLGPPSQESVLIKTRTTVLYIPFEQIECLEINSKTLYFALLDGSTQEMPGNLVDFEDAFLSRPEFIKTHRSYIVNLRCVKALTLHEVISRSGRHFPVSRTAHARVKDAYIQYPFKGK